MFRGTPPVVDVIRYSLSSDTVTFGEIASTFAMATGNNIEYVRVPYNDAVEAMVKLGFPRWQAGGVAELFKMVRRDDLTCMRWHFVGTLLACVVL